MEENAAFFIVKIGDVLARFAHLLRYRKDHCQFTEVLAARYQYTENAYSACALIKWMSFCIKACLFERFFG